MTATARRRPRRAPDGWRLQSWDVTIAEHDIGHHHVPGRRAVVAASTPEIACRQAIQWAHTDSSVPPWRPYVRESLRHTTATPARSREAA